MDTELEFQIAFHGPVRVGTGRAAGGRDDTVDPETIPASTIKGLMRVESRRLFPVHLTNAVFGAVRPSAWHWSDVTFPDEQTTRITARIRIEAESHSAAHGGLFLTENLWPATGTFRIQRMMALTDAEARDQVDVLLASALSVHSIGADRARGYGWVSLSRLSPASAANPEEPSIVDPALVDRILALGSQLDPGGAR